MRNTNNNNNNSPNKIDKIKKSGTSSDSHDNSFREFIKSSEDIQVYTHDKYNPLDEPKRKTNISVPSSFHDPLLVDEQDLHFQLSEHLWRPLVNAEDYLFYFQHGVQYKTIRKLRAGKIRIEDHLDLHQMNKEQARAAIAEFISKAYSQEKRCIQIIHGKGTRSGSNNPILKNLVNHWLHDINIVLGFCSCPDSLGGTGAVLILLQRNNH